MDLATILGLIVALGAIAAPRYLGVPSSDAMYAQSALYVAVGALGAALVGRRMKDLFHLPDLLRQVLWQSGEQTQAARSVVELSEVAHRAGLHSLGQEVDYIQDPFVRKGVQLIADGASPAVIREIMENEAVIRLKEPGGSARLLSSAAAAAPTVGIILSIASVASICSLAAQPAKMLAALPSALSCAIYGLVIGQLVFGPLSEKMKNNIEKQAEALERIIDGFVAIKQQESLLIIKARVWAGSSSTDSGPSSRDTGSSAPDRSIQKTHSNRGLHPSSP